MNYELELWEFFFLHTDKMLSRKSIDSIIRFQIRTRKVK